MFFRGSRFTENKTWHAVYCLIKRVLTARHRKKFMIDDYLLRLNDLQTEEGKRTISIPQCTIMYELWKKHPAPVLLSDIQSKYNLKSYTVSRNCMMLSYDRIKDNGKTRQGKGWIIKNHMSDKYDGRMKEAKLTPQGEKIVERLFERRKVWIIK